MKRILLLSDTHGPLWPAELFYPLAAGHLFDTKYPVPSCPFQDFLLHWKAITL